MKHKRLARIRGAKLNRALKRLIATYWIILTVSILTNPYIIFGGSIFNNYTCNSNQIK